MLPAVLAEGVFHQDTVLLGRTSAVLSNNDATVLFCFRSSSIFNSHLHVSLNSPSFCV